MSNERDILIWKLQKDLDKARLALGKIYSIVDTVYNWDCECAVFKLERDKIKEIATTLQEFFDSDAKEATKKEIEKC